MTPYLKAFIINNLRYAKILASKKFALVCPKFFAKVQQLFDICKFLTKKDVFGAFLAILD